jgi:peptide/nickel transport system permease protein
MAGWLLVRLLQAILVVLVMTVIVFAGLHAIGNPVDNLISQDADAAERARVIAQFGLDLPLWQQYLRFLGGALHGDLGHSFVYNEPSLSLIGQRLPATLELAVSATLLAVLIGLPLGMVAGLYPDAWYSKTIMAGSILGFSLPTFWVGLMMILLFGVSLHWLPTGDRGATVSVFGVGWSFLTLDGLRHLALPALNLSLFNIALVMRLVRAGVREAMPMDYVKFARAKGLTPFRIIGVHVLRNILIPVVTVIGLEFGSTVAFSVVTESIFAWPGMGRLIIESILKLDRPVITAYLVMIVLMFVTINLIVDILYMILDPRVRQQS